MTTTRAVVLARGLGTRMRAADPAATTLTPEQNRAAAAGLKAMIPMNGRPFLDYILSALADAGLGEVALVVAPDHEGMRRYYTVEAPPSRVTLSFAVQTEPLGTAHAVLAVEDWAGTSPFLAVNADNLYPVGVLATLASLEEPGLPAFDPDGLVATGNISRDRIQTFALIEVDRDGYLRHIIEKPSRGAGLEDPRAPAVVAGTRRSVSMNCWRFDARIFSACRDVPRSARGEYEIPEAVALAIDRGVRFKTFPARGPVLDLSRRADAADIAKRLAGISPRP